MPAFEEKENLVNVKVVNTFVPSEATTTTSSVMTGPMNPRFPYPSSSSQVRIESQTLGDPTIDNQDQWTYQVEQVTLEA